VKEDWRALAPRLAAHRPVLVFDNRGMGESDVPPGPYTMAQLADDTLGLTQHVFGAAAAVALVGISMGGMIAQHVVLRAPAGTVRRVVLGCTSHGGTGEHARGRAARRAADPRVHPPPPPPPPPPPRCVPGYQGPNSLPPTDAFLAAMTPPSVPAGKLAAAVRRQVTADVLRLNLTPAWVAANPAAFEAYVDDNLARRRPQRGIRTSSARRPNPAGVLGEDSLEGGAVHLDVAVGGRRGRDREEAHAGHGAGTVHASDMGMGRAPCPRRHADTEGAVEGLGSVARPRQRLTRRRTVRGVDAASSGVHSGAAPGHPSARHRGRPAADPRAGARRARRRGRGRPG